MKQQITENKTNLFFEKCCLGVSSRIETFMVQDEENIETRSSFMLTQIYFFSKNIININ